VNRRRFCSLLAVAAAAGSPTAAAATPVVPVFTQHRIATVVPGLAYVPARVAIGWRYERWTHNGPLRIFFRNKAGREIVFVAARLTATCRAGMEKSFQLDGVKVWWAQTAVDQRAWRCVNGMKLTAESSLTPDQFADVGLGRIAASGHRIL
jgi:hypothetical protein